MKAPTRLPLILVCTVGGFGLAYAGVLIYAHGAGAAWLPVQANTLVLTILGVAFLAASNWYARERQTEQLRQEIRAGQRAVGVAPVHRVIVQRPRVADWAAADKTQPVERPRPSRRGSHRRAPKSAPTPPSQVPGLDAEVIELGRRITNKIDRSGA